MQSNFAPNCPTAKPRRRAAKFALLLVVVVWAMLVSTGLWWLGSYENAPGLATAAPGQWPSNSRIQLARNELTLVMLAHPRCPCTRASIGELSSIMAHSQGRLRAYVLFVKPENAPDNWDDTDLWRNAAAIPGVTPVKDSDGTEARMFNAATSGHTVLYSNQGQLLFSGGITGSRGHFGDNAGQGSIIAIVNSEVPEQRDTSVFGCPLFNPESECQVSIDEKSKH